MRHVAILAVVGFALSWPGPAKAAVTVIGGSAARGCYEAARSSDRSPVAMAQCDQALSLAAISAEDEVATYVNRGILRATRGDLAGALGDYDAALARNPKQPEAWLNKGLATLRNGDALAALPLFEAAVANQTSEPAIAHYGRAVANEQAGNLRAAYGDYLRASQLAPKWRAPRDELDRFRVGKASPSR